MIEQILCFLAITAVAGTVSMSITENAEKTLKQEIISFLAIIVGGIAGFTALVVVISIFFQ